MSAHKAAACRQRDGWSLWRAECACGWRAAAGSREDATARADEHNALTAARVVLASMTCDCWHPDEAEFHPTYKCAKCRLEDALGVAA